MGKDGARKHGALHESVGKEGWSHVNPVKVENGGPRGAVDLLRRKSIS